MNTPIPVIVDGQAGIFAHSKARVATLNAKAKRTAMPHGRTHPRPHG